MEEWREEGREGKKRRGREIERVEEWREEGREGRKRGGREEQVAELRGESNESMIVQISGTDQWMKWKGKRIELE